MSRQAAIITEIRGLLDEMGGLLGYGKTEITPYSQNDPLWKGDIYAGGYTFARGGCYVTAVAMIASLAGYTDDPPAVAAKMRDASCFNGAMLSYPHRIPDAYPLLEWPDDAWYNRSSDSLHLHRMDKMRAHIDEYGAIILKVDHRPENYLYNMHFVVAVGYGADDFEIIDPLDGERGSFLGRYGHTRGWTAAQAIFGYRALRVR